MKILLNSFKLETINNFNIKELIIYLNLQDYPIAIEVNKIFIPKSEWEEIFLKNSDKIEIVTIVGGG